MSDQVGGQQFYSALQAKAMDAVKSILNTPLYPVQYPAQGDFKWFWQNTNQVFNDATYQYVNANVSRGAIANTIALSPAGGFANAYVAVLNAMVFSLNKGDQAKLTAAQTNASVQAGTIISDYQTSFGTITDAMMTTAGVKTKQDYVIGYVLGSQWSGANPPLRYTEMASARNLKRLLPNAPASGDQVIADVTVYLNLMQPVNGFSDQLQQGTWTLGMLKNNTQYPSAANGGMKTFNPNTGEVSTDYNDGWAINSSVASINNDLQNTGRAINIGMTTSQASGSSMTVHIDSQAGFTVGSWLQFSTSVGATYDMSTVQGTSTDCSVSMTYAGYSVIPAAPSPWQQATNVGFYFPDPVSQAVKNGTQDVTGFKFQNTPPYDLGPMLQGGNFGLLTNLLISNYPTIKITYSNANFSSFKQAWSEKVSGNLSLFGFIKLGSFSEGAYSSSYAQGSDNSTFSVTFSASNEVTGVPQNLKQAYVIGGCLANPGVSA